MVLEKSLKNGCNFFYEPALIIHTVSQSLSQTVCPSVYQPLIQLDSQLHFCNQSNSQLISVSAIHTVIQSVRQSINLLYMQLASQSAVRKKMAAVHFTTIPCKLNTANYTYSHILGGAKFVPLPLLGLKFIKLFCAFL